MGGLIDHIMINTNEFDKALVFYNWFMPKIGYKKGRYNKFEGEDRVMDWSGELSGMLVCESDKKMRSDRFDKHRVGLREIAFYTDNKDIVDEVGRDAKKYGGKILDAPHNYGDGYVVFLTDPDGMKLEVDFRSYKVSRK
jgi:predicted lactoylglutathione lyase